MSIGTRIKEARERKGWSRLELAEHIGVTASAISNYENDISSPREQVLFALFRELNCDANYLFQDDAPFTPNKPTPSEMDMIKKYRRLTDNGRATVDNVIDSLLEAGQPAREQEQKEPENILRPVAARGGTGEPLEATTDTERLLKETKEWRREQIKNSDVF